ncbi:MAG: HU family DNA-binding protein [Acidobacteria bacterium]|nr:HU family DNA-binding protein [Acidobacteriota bacterium]
MNRADLIEAISERVGITKAQAAAALETLISSMSASLKAGEKVTLVGFGTFHAAERKPRMGRDPRTSEVIEIPARIVPRFKPGRLLVEKLNETKKKRA